MILVKKMKIDILRQLLEMKDSDEEYEKWMSELEVERAQRLKPLGPDEILEHPL